MKAISDAEEMFAYQKSRHEQEITEEPMAEISTKLEASDPSISFEKETEPSKIQQTCESNNYGEEELDPDSQLPKTFSMSLIRTMQPAGKEFALFKNVIHLLVICLTDLNAGTINFSDVLGINRQPNFREFV